VGLEPTTCWLQVSADGIAHVGFRSQIAVDLRCFHPLVCVFSGLFTLFRGPTAAQAPRTHPQGRLSLASNSAGGITGGSCSSHSRRSASPLTMKPAS
jgi:hypothetical protein